MSQTSVKEEILRELDALDETRQGQVLRYTRMLARARPVGIPGRELLRFVGVIHPDRAQEMEQAIEEDCERIDPSEW